MKNQALNDPNAILRKPELGPIDGLSNSARDREIRRGTYPAQVKLSTDPRSRAVGWLLGEVLARRDAVIQGKSDDEVRKLVADMIAARRAAA
jgi:predicted DNA-binding transcriptional regulator AlpA